VRRLAIAIGGLLTLLPASPAAATVAIGQLPPATAAPQNCGPSSGAYVQSSVTSDRSYAVPANGTRITSWNTTALATSGQVVSLMVFRPLGGDSFLTVAHDGPHSFSTPGVKTFSVSIPVQPGDLVGLNPDVSTNFPTQCGFVVSGETGEFGSFPNPPPADGGSGTFFPNPGNRVNVNAHVEVSNAFTFAVTGRNKRRGTVSVTVSAVGPGRLGVGGKRFKPSEATLGNQAETVTLNAVPAGKLKRGLNKRGRARTGFFVSFTPDGGDTNTQFQPVTLVKKIKKR
jgi:hypothetical protein